MATNILMPALSPTMTEGTLARWLKNARMMKPGSIMPTLGTGELDPQTGKKLAAGLDDRQIADIVAYLMALK